MIELPETGFVRLRQIVGRPEANPPELGIFPISRSMWQKGIAAGDYPRGHKMGNHTRVTVWRVEDIRELIKKIANDGFD